MNPAERQTPEKDETWTLASDNHDVPNPGENCSRFPDDEVKPIDKKSCEGSQTWEYEPNLPRSHETRKSKTKRMKNYIRKKCKDALSKGDETGGDRRREKCTSWYVDDKHDDVRGEIFDKVDPRGSRSSLYEDATDMQIHIDENVAEIEDANPISGASLETLIVDDQILDKCESSDTLVPELSEISTNCKSPHTQTIEMDTVISATKSDSDGVIDDETEIDKLLPGPTTSASISVSPVQSLKFS